MSKKRIKAKRVLFASVWWHNELMHAVTKKAAQRGWHLNMETLLSGKINANWSGDGIVCIPAAPSRDLANQQKGSVRTYEQLSDFSTFSICQILIALHGTRDIDSMPHM
jgi:hypothetical protein